MSLHPLAGQPAPTDLLIDVGALERAYYERHPDLSDPNQLVNFGTSGHRGTALNGSFTEDHILAMTQAICDYRRHRGIEGLLFMGKDPHALSTPAQRNALEVLAANGVATIIQHHDGVTPTPVISHAILTHNRGAPTTSRTASWSRHRTIRQLTAASSTTRPTGDRPTPT
jgi:phosphoglucomutase